MIERQARPAPTTQIYGVIPMGHGRLFFTPELTSCKPVSDCLSIVRPQAAVCSAETLLHTYGEITLKVSPSIDFVRHHFSDLGQICVAVAKPINLPPDFDEAAAYRDGSQRFVASDALFTLTNAHGTLYAASDALACARQSSHRNDALAARAVVIDFARL